MKDSTGMRLKQDGMEDNISMPPDEGGRKGGSGGPAERLGMEDVAGVSPERRDRKESACASPKTGAGSGIYRRFIKRPADFALALAAIIFLSPVMLAVAAMVRIRLGRPVIFKQERPGLDGKIFTLYKFRTMTDERDENGELLPDAARLTKFGRFLRSASLDELPELFNILRGDMSFVGPRPLLVQYLPLYNGRQMRRHEARPGLTGLAQAIGRNALSWEEKFELDVKYVDGITFFGDLKILLLTIKKVLAREGISSGGSATAEPFRGSEKQKAGL